MKQHRRTHRTSISEDVVPKEDEDGLRRKWSKRKQGQQGRPESSYSQSDGEDFANVDPPNSPTNSRFDEALRRSSNHHRGSRSYHHLNEITSRMNGEVGMRRSSGVSRSGSLTGGLDALAIAASKSHFDQYRR
jgi:hypothetical protein